MKLTAPVNNSAPENGTWLCEVELTTDVVTGGWYRNKICGRTTNPKVKINTGILSRKIHLRNRKYDETPVPKCPSTFFIKLFHGSNEYANSFILFLKCTQA